MRAVTVVVGVVAMAWLVGCGDDSTMGGKRGADLGAQAGADDLAVSGPDLSPCMFRSFAGYTGDNPTLFSFDCSCGCMIDAFENNQLNRNWGASFTSGASFDPQVGVGLGMRLMSTTAGDELAQAGLVSEGPDAQFYLDGDFDLQVAYDLGATAPPGEAHLVLGVRKPKTVNGVAVYQVERAREADGSQVYATALGGVPSVRVPTTATSGLLRLTRQGFTLTAFADGQQVSKLIAQDEARLVVTLAGTLQGCAALDGGGSCGYEPRWHLLQLNHGTLVNQP